MLNYWAGFSINEQIIIGFCPQSTFAQNISLELKSIYGNTQFLILYLFKHSVVSIEAHYAGGTCQTSLMTAIKISIT